MFKKTLHKNNQLIITEFKNRIRILSKFQIKNSFDYKLNRFFYNWKRKITR